MANNPNCNNQLLTSQLNVSFIRSKVKFQQTKASEIQVGEFASLLFRKLFLIPIIPCSEVTTKSLFKKVRKVIKEMEIRIPISTL